VADPGGLKKADSSQGIWTSDPEIEAKCEIINQLFQRFSVENLGFNDYEQSLDGILCKHTIQKIPKIRRG